LRDKLFADWKAQQSPAAELFNTAATVTVGGTIKCYPLLEVQFVPDLEYPAVVYAAFKNVLPLDWLHVELSPTPEPLLPE
jgi:hypothetical protein